MSDRLDLPDLVIDPADTGAADARVELAACVRPMLGSLPDEQRVAIELTDLGHMTQQQAANVRRAYVAPQESWSKRTSVLVVPREMPAGPGDQNSEFGGAIEDRLIQHFRDKPVHIAWPMKDPAFAPDMPENLWLATFPDAEVTRIEDSSHYIQEDAFEILVPKLIEFLQR